MAEEKIVTICSPYAGHIIAVTDKGKVVTATSIEDFKEKVKNLNKK